MAVRVRIRTNIMPDIDMDRLNEIVTRVITSRMMYQDWSDDSETDFDTYSETVINQLFEEEMSKPKVKETLTKKRIVKLAPRRKYNKKDFDVRECSICISRFKRNEYVRQFSCEHVFHKECIDKWLIECDSKCPNCRKDYLKSK